MHTICSIKFLSCMNGSLRSILKIPYHLACYAPKPAPFSSSAVSCEDALVTSAVSILIHHRSKSRWSNLRSLLAPNNHLSASQFSQIALQLRNKPHVVLGFFHFTVNHSLSSHPLCSYATVIHILCRSRLRYHALTLIKAAMYSFCETKPPTKETPIAILEALISTYKDCDSAPFVFDLLVKACLESKKIDSAIEIYTILKSKNVFLNPRTINSLLELVSRNRGCAAGYDLFRELYHQHFDGLCEKGKCDKVLVPSTTTINVVIEGFYREGLVGRVEEVWEEMVGIDCLPNLYSFNILLATYCDAGRMEDAMRVWAEMKNKGFIPDVVTFNTVIGGFCGVEELGRAEEIYRDMVMNGFESTCITYEHLVNGYCKIGGVESAMTLYKDMCRKGFSPGSSTVNAIVRSLCAKNETLAALEFWKSAAKKHEAILEEENYKNLLKGLCMEGKMKDALALQAEMVGRGFEPDLEIYGAFIDGYLKLGNETVACKLRKEMLNKWPECR